jgi:hypothetical protein
MQTENDWLPKGEFQPRRYRPGGVGNWSGHLPFANDLIAAVQPKLLVELGTHYGESYFGFCQAIVENNIACLCYAVDTWVGEPHAGYYDERVFLDVNRYNEVNYSSFSYLLRTTFDEANAQFAEDSIDILHIDGLHTYDAISHDFHFWLPKVKPGGIILLHDIVARHEDFGVWKLWDELEPLGDRFAFTHSSGLGVFRKRGPVSDNGFVQCFFHADHDRRDHIRKFYSLCALKLEYDYARAHRYHPPVSRVLVQVFPSLEAGYSAENVYTADLKPGQWQRITIDLASGIGHGPLRIDLAEQPAIIDLAGIRIRNAVNNEILWSAEGLSETASLAVGGTMTRFDVSDKTGFSRFLSFGSDPQLFLPSLEADHFDQPLLLDTWVRVHLEISSLLPAIKRLAGSGALKLDRRPQQEYQELESKYRNLDQAYQELHNTYQDLQNAHQDLQRSEQDLKKTYEDLQAKYREVESNRQALADAHAAVGNQNAALVDHNAALAKQVAVLAGQEAALKNQYAALRTEHASLEKNYQSLKKKCGEMEQTLRGVLTSHSWRITAPLRNLMLHVRPPEK